MPFATDSGFCHEGERGGADIGEWVRLTEIAACDLYFVKMEETAPLR
jgi:hypothetical protein